MSEKEYEITIVKADWSDKDHYVTEKVKFSSFDDGTEGFYFLDTEHDVRIWVKSVSKKEKKLLSFVNEEMEREK